MTTTGRQAFRYAIEKTLGNGGFTVQRRTDEVMLARRCRNIFFNALAPEVGRTGAGVVPNTIVEAQTQQYGFPIIVTDVFNYAGNLLNLSYWQNPNFLVRLFTTEDSAGVDFFGSDNLTDVVQTLTHMRNSFSPTIVDGPSNQCRFMPYLLRVGQTIRARWNILSFTSPGTVFWVCPELDFRGVTVLPERDPYACLTGRVYDTVCEYIATSEPETVILDLTVPAVSLSGTIGEAREFATEPQQRPLLVYGIATNINGVQLQIRDLATQWQFCSVGPQSTVAMSAGVPVPFIGPSLQGGVPIYLGASNSELTNRDAYHMLAVPHFLEPNNSLVFRLTNGLRPNAVTANVYQQVYNVNGLFGLGNEEGRISLLCRTI